MRFALRGYQTRCLDALAAYLRAAGQDGAKRAFVIQTERPYRSVPELPELPYVCLRVPTGGGKTIMAAHAVGIAAREYLQRDTTTCLWLVPSNAILEQTLTRLRTHGDPYREALVSHFGGRATVLSLREALVVQRGTLDGETVVVVSTLAALRVDDTEGRKVYEQNGVLEHHFTGLTPALLDGLERREDGTAVESLANVLRLRRPVVIMDEAHRARTPLSFTTLARFGPACVTEFTATPEINHAPHAGFFASNVLAHVSAAELKAEEMIKLPLGLWTCDSWENAVTEALARQRTLEEVAAREEEATGEPLRPIVLFQAEPQRQRGGTVTVEELERSLLEDHQIPREQIAVATGSRRELDGMDLTDPTCPVRYVITVQALREGWDCPWAYVLCSVANQSSSRAVEQLLGRVLRLPGARRKRHDALNRSYAYVVSASFADAASNLRDALVDNGFEKFEAERLVQDGGALPGLFAATPEAPASALLTEAPDLDAVEQGSRGMLAFDPGTGRLTTTAPIPVPVAERLAETVQSLAAKAAILNLARESRGEPARRAPVGSGATPPLVLPRLAVRVNGTLELFEESHVLAVSWRLADKDHVLSEADYPLIVRGQGQGEVDVTAAGRLEISHRDAVSRQLSALTGEGGWTVAELASWLDASIPHPELTQGDASLFIHRALEDLMERGGVTLDQLAQDKYRLRAALERRIDAHRAAQRKAAYQGLLFGREAMAVESSPDLALTLHDPDRYAPNWYYEGPFAFRKHLFPLVGELQTDGEETDCAMHLDTHDQVEVWVRNLDRRARDSFWLQTATDRFYPDFVGRLVDGRVFALEYKGSHLWSGDDAKEKRVVGELWAGRSGGRCVFLMPNGMDLGAIDAAFADPSRT